MSIVAANWARRVEITDANVSPTLTGFRALITQANLPAEIFSRAGVVDGGGDLRVCLNSDGTGQLPLEVVEFVKGTSTAILWTRFASFTSGESLWLFYDKPGETQPLPSAAFGRDEVWQDSTYRLGGNGQTDVTGTTTTSFVNGATVSGTVNGFPAITPNTALNSSRLVFDNSAVLDGYTGNLSISAWVNTTSSSNLRSIVTCREANTRQFDFRLESGKTSFLRSGSPEVNPVLNFNQDYYLAMRVVGNTVFYYIDGAFAGTGNAGAAQSTQAIDISVGGHLSGNSPFQGQIANADLLNGVELTGPFFNTEYENQKNTSTFWTTGTPENTAGGGGGVTVPVTGVTATGAVGSPTIITSENFTVTGVAATGAVGNVTIAAGEQFTVTGVAATGAVGSPTIITTDFIPVTGVAATGAIGSVGVTAGGGIAVPATGVTATGAVGNVTVSVVVSVNTNVTGVAATASLGNVNATAGARTTITGVAALVEVGDIIVTTSENSIVTGVSATGAIGNVIAGERSNALPTGVEATGVIGNVSVLSRIVVPVTGVSAFGRVGGVNVWSLIDTNQNADWQPINDNQTPNWQSINDTQTPNWNKINT